MDHQFDELSLGDLDLVSGGSDGTESTSDQWGDSYAFANDAPSYTPTERDFPQVSQPPATPPSTTTTIASNAADALKGTYDAGALALKYGTDAGAAARWALKSQGLVFGAMADLAENGAPKTWADAGSFAAKSAFGAIPGSSLLDKSFGYLSDSMTGGTRYQKDYDGAWLKQIVDWTKTQDWTPEWSMGVSA